MSEQWADRDGDGIPDVIEDTLEEAREIKRRFGMKPILIILITVIVCASFGIQTWLYVNLRSDYITLQHQYDWQQTEKEIEINAEKIKERQKLLADLTKKAADLQKDIDKKRGERSDAEMRVTEKPYARRNSDEASKLGNDDLRRGFSELGFPAKRGSSQ